MTVQTRALTGGGGGGGGAGTISEIVAGAGLTGSGLTGPTATLDVVAGDGSIVVNPNDIVVGVISDAQHGNRGGGSLHDLAIASGAAGFMSGADKAKLDGIAAGAVATHAALPDTAGDDHADHTYNPGRSGGQTINGGIINGEQLVIRGTAGANLGLINAQSPINFSDVTPANALSPYSIRDASTSTITSGFVGGTFGDLRTVTFTNALFVYETLRGSPRITSGVNPAFAAFTLFNALPILAAGSTASFNPLQALILNAAAVHEHAFTGTRTAANNTGVNFAPQIRTLSTGTMNVTATTGLNVQPQWNTAVGSTINFGTIRGVRCNNPTVALFGSSAGTELMTAYIGLDWENITFGGTVTKAAVRSAQAAATNAWFLLQTGSASSQFRGQVFFPVDLFGITMGLSNDFQFGWGASGFFFQQFNATADQMRWSNPSANRFLLAFDSGITQAEFNLACYKFSLGAQTGAVGNQVGVFVAGTRDTSVAGEWSDFLLTQAGNITLNAAMSLVAGWTVNAPSMTLGTGSVTTATALNVGGNPNQGTNRYGLRVISNPSGGTLNYCARFEGAAGVRVDGIFEHAGATLGFQGATPIAQPAAYTITNPVTRRSFDTTLVTLQQLAEVVGTVIQDLINYGLLQ